MRINEQYAVFGCAASLNAVSVLAAGFTSGYFRVIVCVCDGLSVPR